MWILDILLVIVDVIGGVFGLARKGHEEKREPVLRERKEQPYER